MIINAISGSTLVKLHNIAKEVEAARALQVREDRFVMRLGYRPGVLSHDAIGTLLDIRSAQKYRRQIKFKNK